MAGTPISVIGENNNANGQNPYVSKNDLDKGLLGDLEGAAINRGTAFFSNQATSAFTKKNDKGDSALSVTQGVAGVAGAAVGGTLNIASGAVLTVSTASRNVFLMQQFTGKCINIAINESTKILTTYTVKMTLIPVQYPVNVVKRTIYWYSYFYPIYLKEELEKLEIHPEDIDDALSEEQDKENDEKTKKSLTEKLAEMQQKVNNAMQSVQKPLQDLSEYIAEGPEYLIDKGNKIIQSGIDNTNKFCDKLYNDTKQKSENSADKKGKKIGDKKARKAAKKSAEKTKKLIDKKKSLQKSNESKAKAQSKKALLKIKGLMGG